MRKSVIVVSGFLLSASALAGACLECRDDVRNSSAAELGRHVESKRSNVIREAACCEWSSALSEIEDEREKISAVEMVMDVLTDADFLEEVSSEYIGVDEKIAIESLMRIIVDGKSEQGVAKAKETYEFVTGDEWKGADEARRWLAEEYTPPELTE